MELHKLVSAFVIMKIDLKSRACLFPSVSSRSSSESCRRTISSLFPSVLFPLFFCLKYAIFWGKDRAVVFPMKIRLV